MTGRLRTAVAAVALAAVVALPMLGNAAPIEAASWIDAPLDGSVLPVANTSVVAHSADQALVRAVVLEVDGTVLAERAIDPPARIATSRFTWLPPGAGTFLLVVRARNAADEWGAPAAATVVIASDAPALPTDGPSGSPAPGDSSSPGPSGSAQVPPSAGSTGGPGATSAPGATRTPPPRTPPPTPKVTQCPLPGPQLLAPPDDELYAAADDPQPIFEWDWNGPPSCLDHFILTLNLDQQIEEYADGGYQRDYVLAPDTFVYQSPIILLGDDSDLATGCGYYFWTVAAVDPDGNWEQSPQVRAIRVCPGRTG